MAERARKEAELGRKLTGPKPSDTDRAASATTPGEHHRSAFADHRAGLQGVLQGYNAQAAATTGHIVVAAEITNTTNDQPHFVPMANAVTDNLIEAGHRGGAGTFVADAGYWTSANGTDRCRCRGVDRDTEVVVAQSR